MWKPISVFSNLGCSINKMILINYKNNYYCSSCYCFTCYNLKIRMMQNNSEYSYSLSQQFQIAWYWLIAYKIMMPLNLCKCTSATNERMKLNWWVNKYVLFSLSFIFSYRTSVICTVCHDFQWEQLLALCICSFKMIFCMDKKWFTSNTDIIEENYQN